MSTIKFHDDAVQEVVDYLKQNRLFAVAPNYEVLRDIPAKLVESLDDIPKYRESDEEGALIEGDFTWYDLLRSSSRDYHKFSRDFPHEEHCEFDDKMRAIFNDCWSYAEPRVYELLGMNHTYEVGSMVDSILRHRAVCGIIPGHLDTIMWLALINGGFPCGWYGRTDSDGGGMLAVYAPNHKAGTNSRSSPIRSAKPSTGI